MFVIAFRALAVSLLAASMLAGTASAQIMDLGDLRIVDPMAYEAKAGTRTKLKMGFVNEGLTAVHVVTVTSPVASGTRFRLNSGKDEPETAIDAISVPGEEVLALGAATVWVELLGLQRNLRPGEIFPVTLHFANGAVATIDVGVEPMPDRSLPPALDG